MEVKDKRFLVIGGAGLIGSHLIEELLTESIKEVIVYDNFCRGTEDNLKQAAKDPRCHIWHGDIMDTSTLYEMMENIDGVFHLAALWLLHCYQYPTQAFEVNVKGTFNVIEGCKKRKISRLIYSSSASVYGDALEEPMTENHPYNNWTFYGATKIAGEQMFKAYHRQYSLNGIGLRYMNVYGPRQDYHGTYVAVIMRMLDSIYNHKPIIVHGDGSQAYDFVYVCDVAKANLCAMKSDIPFGFYNVGTGIKTSISQLAEMIIELTKSNQPITYLPEKQSFVTNRVGDTTRAKEDLGFSATTTLRTGLQELIRWYENRR